ncbi:surf-like protein [Cryptotrichosporon argae]
MLAKVWPADPVFAIEPARPASTAAPAPSSIRATLFKPITIILIFAPLLTGYLGVWQVQRLKWKVALIEEVDRNLAKEPMILPGVINLAALPDFAFRRVLVKGRLAGPPILLGPQTRDGVPGAHLILPLVRGGGASTILLNSGFITTEHAAAIRAGGPVPGLPSAGEGDEVIVEAMLTKKDANARNMFTPENRVKSNEWYWKDVEGMAEWLGGEEKGVQPVLVDAIDHGEVPASLLMQQGIPVGRPPHIELRNQHLTYAITWFSLCAATTAMLGLLFRRGGRIVVPKRRAFGEK